MTTLQPVVSSVCTGTVAEHVPQIQIGMQHRVRYLCAYIKCSAGVSYDHAEYFDAVSQEEIATIIQVNVVATTRVSACCSGPEVTLSAEL